MSTVRIDNVVLWTDTHTGLAMMRGIRKERTYNMPVFAYSVNHEDNGAWCDMKSRLRLIAMMRGDK